MKKALCLLFTFLSFCSLQGNNINWSNPPEILSGAGVNANDPQVAVDANGNVISAWIEGGYVKSSSKLAAGNWTSAVILSSGESSSVKLVSDSNGNATAIWIEKDKVKAASKPFSSNWKNPILLSNNGVSSPVIAVDSEGDVVAAWVRYGMIETSTKPFGKNWQAKVSIASGCASSPGIAISGTSIYKRAVLVWDGTWGSVNAVFSSTRFIMGGSWTPEQVVSDVNHNAMQASVAIDSNSNALAVWYAYDIVGKSHTNVIVNSAALPASSYSWSSVSSLSEPGIRNPSSLSTHVAFDSIGNAIALWSTSFDDETFNIQSAVKPLNGQWSAPSDLVTTNLYAYSAGLSVTTYGDALALYMFYNGSALLVQSVESDINGFLNNIWSVPITISAGTENAYPKVAASLSGNVINAAALWVSSNGSHNVIAASTGSKTLVLPPSNLHITQSQGNLGVFTEYYNTLTWNSSTDPNVVGYLIFRNGLFLDQVGVGTLQYVDSNRAHNGSVTYSVTAIDGQQTQSTTVSLSFP